MKSLTKDQRRKIAADEIAALMKELHPEAAKGPAYVWRNTVMMYGILENMLRHGETTASGLREIMEREGLEFDDA
jgi:hypothetical protein